MCMKHYIKQQITADFKSRGVNRKKNTHFCQCVLIFERRSYTYSNSDAYQGCELQGLTLMIPRCKLQKKKASIHLKNAAYKHDTKATYSAPMRCPEYILLSRTKKLSIRTVMDCTGKIKHEYCKDTQLS